LTIGVLNRVEALADRPAGFTPGNKPMFKSLVPLQEIIAAVYQKGITTKAVSAAYEQGIQYFGNEFNILQEAGCHDLRKGLPAGIAEAVLNIRQGNVQLMPGYDGVYGKIILDTCNRAARPAKRYQEELV
jgi:PHP family Zn ribbon phosphoesterase